MMRAFYLTLLISIANSCVPVKRRCEGQARLVNKIYDSVEHKFIESDIFPDLKLWFRDSIVIEEIKRIERNSFNGAENITSVVDHYTVIDLTTKAIFEYKNFSDTSKFIKKATLIDSVSLDEGWSFWISKKFRSEAIGSIDTTINNIKLSQINLFLDVKDTSLKYRGYLRCNIKNPMFNLGKITNLNTDCLIVRLDAIASPAQIPISTEIQFISDQLTEEETKVFNAWGRNAKKLKQ